MQIEKFTLIREFSGFSRFNGLPDLADFVKVQVQGCHEVEVHQQHAETRDMQITGMYKKQGTITY